jgi:dTDP-4-dehydrorhamnose reductase
LKKRILITGSTGMLGSDVVDFFLKKTEYEVFGISYSSDSILIPERNFRLSLTNENDVKSLMVQIRPDVIVNCAANVNLEYCEKNRDNAFDVNSNAVSKLLKYSNDAKFVHISTDSIFDGIKGNYSENDIPDPLNEYSKSKYAAERIIFNEKPSSAIIIRSNIYGFHVPVLKNSLFEWFISNANKGNKISGYDNVIFNPLYTRQLVRIIDELLMINYTGLINAGSIDSVSKYDFLILLKKEFDKTNLIERGHLKTTANDIQRPLNTSLNISKLKDILNKDFSLVSGVQELRQNFIIKYKI